MEALLITRLGIDRADALRTDISDYESLLIPTLSNPLVIDGSHPSVEECLMSIKRHMSNL